MSACPSKRVFDGPTGVNTLSVVQLVEVDLLNAVECVIQVSDCLHSFAARCMFHKLQQLPLL